jgi:mannose-6-phosphate isomerase-like protein (cupin superfamily)
MKTNSRRKVLKTLSTSLLAGLVLPELQAKNTTGEPLKAVYTAPNTFQKAPDGFHIGGNIGKGGMQTGVKIRSSQTNGVFSCVEVVVQPKTMGPPPHLHRNLDEIAFVLEGTAHVLCGDETYIVEAGGWHLRPRGLVHTFWNASDKPLKFVDLYPNGTFDLYLEELGRIGEKFNLKKINEDKMRELQAINDKNHDVEWRFDLMMPIIEKYGLK